MGRELFSCLFKEKSYNGADDTTTSNHEGTRPFHLFPQVLHSLVSAFEIAASFRFAFALFSNVTLPL